jgi:hypothetical protein
MGLLYFAADLELLFVEILVLIAWVPTYRRDWLER